jgi:hypothetical protein
MIYYPSSIRTDPYEFQSKIVIVGSMVSVQRKTSRKQSDEGARGVKTFSEPSEERARASKGFHRRQSPE